MEHDANLNQKTLKSGHCILSRKAEISGIKHRNILVLFNNMGTGNHVIPAMVAKVTGKLLHVTI